MSLLEIKLAAASEDYAAARTLLEEYASELAVDLCFQGFADEIASLPKMYGPPHGCLLLAFVNSNMVGCVAVRRHQAEICEMKRLYVRQGHRGEGIGRQLAELAIGKARELGYSQMRLDTLPAMTEAQALYAALGFEEIPAYYPNPEPGVRYFGRSLVNGKAVRRST